MGGRKVDRVVRPMDHYLQAVLDELDENQVVVVQAETGVGKTSRIPQAILDNDPHTKVYMTQPTRAAVGMNSRFIAQETGTAIGGELVDYSLKGERLADKASRLELLIDQSLVNRIISLVNRIIHDKKLPDGVLIIDEAHERSVDIDLLLFLIRLYLPNSPDTKVLITSATIDTKKFQDYFKYKNSGALNTSESALEERSAELSGIAVGDPIIAYNETLHRIATKEYRLGNGEHHSQGAVRATLDFVTEFYNGTMTRPGEEEGDEDIPVSEGTMLVFLPGKDDIHEAYSKVERHLREVGKLDSFELLRAYRGANLNRVDAPLESGKLRVIFTTEILKASVTPPQTVCVIDSLQVKRNVENKYGVSKLEKVTQSGAEADQARGRTGRECTGWYVPITFEDEYANITRKNGQRYWPVPAILREGILTTALKIANVGEDLRHVQLIDQPDREKIGAAIDRLQSIHALDFEGRITPFGKELLKFSTSPENARSFFRAKELDVLPEMLLASKIIDNEGIFYVPGERDSEVLVKRDELRINLKQSLLNVCKGKIRIQNFSVLNPPISTVDELLARLKSELAQVAPHISFQGFEACREKFQKEYVERGRALTRGASFSEFVDLIKIGDSYADSELLKLHYLHSIAKDTYDKYYTSLQQEAVAPLGKAASYTEKEDVKRALNNQLTAENAADFIRVFNRYQQGYKKWCISKRIPHVDFSIGEEDLVDFTFPCSVQGWVFDGLLHKMITLNRVSVTSDAVSQFLGVRTLKDSPDYYSVSISAGSLDPRGGNRYVPEHVSEFFTTVVSESVRGEDNKSRLRSIAKQRQRKFAMKPGTDGKDQFVPSDLFASIQALRLYKVEQQKNRELHKQLTRELDQKEDAWLLERGTLLEEFRQIHRKRNKSAKEERLVASIIGSLRDYSSSLVAGYRQEYGYEDEEVVFVEKRMRAWCNYNSLHYKTVTQVERDVRDLVTELKNSTLNLDRSVYDRRHFDLEALGRSMLVGMVYNVVLGDGNGIASTSITTSFDGIPEPYVYGGIRKSKVRLRRATDQLHFAELCVPIHRNWLLEENPHLCTEVINSSSTVRHDEDTDRFYGIYQQRYASTTYDFKEKELEPQDTTAYLANLLEKGTSGHPENKQSKLLCYEVQNFYRRILDNHSKAQQVAADFTALYANKVKNCQTKTQFLETSIKITEEELRAYLGDDYKKFRVEFPLSRPKYVHIGEEAIPISFDGYTRHIVFSLTLDQFMKLEAEMLPVVPNYTVFVTCRGEDGFLKQTTLSVESFKEKKEEVYAEYCQCVWSLFLNTEKGKEFYYKYGDKAYIRDNEKNDRKVVTCKHGEKFPPLPEAYEWSNVLKLTCGYAYELVSEPWSNHDESKWYISVWPTAAAAAKAQAEADSKKQDFDAIWAAKQGAERLKQEAAALLEEVIKLRSQINTDKYELYGLTIDEVANKTFTRTEKNYPYMIERRVPSWLGSGDAAQVARAHQVLIDFKKRLSEALEFYISNARSGRMKRNLKTAFVPEAPSGTGLDDTEAIQFIGHISSGALGDTQLAVRLDSQDGLYYLQKFDEKRASWTRYKGYNSSLLRGGFPTIAAVQNAIVAAFRKNYSESFVPANVDKEELEATQPPLQPKEDLDDGLSWRFTRNTVAEKVFDEKPKFEPPPAPKKFDDYDLAVFDQTRTALPAVLFNEVEAGYDNVATMNTKEWRFAVARLLLDESGIGFTLLLTMSWHVQKLEKQIDNVGRSLKKSYNEYAEFLPATSTLTEEYDRARAMIDVFPQVRNFYIVVRDTVTEWMGKEIDQHATFVKEVLEYVGKEGVDALPAKPDKANELAIQLIEKI